MNSRLRLTPEQRWTVIREAWERGDFDRMTRLLEKHSTELPPGAGAWLAGVLTGRIKRPKGRPRVDAGQQSAAEFARDLRIPDEYRTWLMFYQWLTDGPDARRGDTPAERAIEHVAGIHGMSPDAVSRLVHPRRKVKAPKSST